MTAQAPRILIVSFTDISRDPRAIKQVRAALELGQVTTCSFGPQPHPDVEHLELDPAASYPTSRLMQFFDTQAREREVFAWSYARIPYVRQARSLLRGRRFDAAIANNPDAARLVRAFVKPAAIHVDLHEYFPGVVFDDGSVEAHRQQRYLDWLHDIAVVGTGSSTVVSQSIADHYRSRGIAPKVLTNAGPSVSLPLRPTGAPIRYVHSGNSQPGRGLRRIMRAIANARTEVTLDLFLVPNDLEFHHALLELAERLGERIRVNDPVPQAKLVSTLHDYDVGIVIAPPTILNTEFSLPNKLFDFIQARLAVVVGPLSEMAGVVRENGLGRVTADFSEEAIRATIEELTPEQVDSGKLGSDRTSKALSGDKHHESWLQILQTLFDPTEGNRP